MVDWSKHDDEAQEIVRGERIAAQERADLLRRLQEITKSHADRLVAAKTPGTNGRAFDDPLNRLSQAPFEWAVGIFPHPPHGNLVYYIDLDGKWYAYIQSVWFEDVSEVTGRGVRREGELRHAIEPPVLDVDQLAMELSKHYFRATGK